MSTSNDDGTPAVFGEMDESDVGRKNVARARAISRVAAVLRDWTTKRGMTVRDLASAMGTSPSQAQRILANSAPTNVTLSSLLRAADALELHVEIRLHDRRAERSPYIHADDGRSGYTFSFVPAVRTEVVSRTHARTPRFRTEAA